MMRKFIFFCLSLAVMAGAMAQTNNSLHGNKDVANPGLYNHAQRGAKEITFNASDVQFWCGTGINQAVIVVGWDDDTDPQAIGWGVRWNGSVVAIDLIDSIATYDSRFSYQFGGGLISDVEYADGTLSLASQMNWWCYYLNGDWANGYGSQDVVDGDYLELSGDCSWSLTSATAAVDPNASTDTTPTIPDATIASTDILNWLGTGAHEAIIMVNWNGPDTCLAWGVRFDADTITVKDAMDTIMCKDFRFSYVPGAWGVSDIVYNDYQGTRYALTDVENYNYWWSNYNGTAAWYGYDQQTLVHGDQFKWGDPTCGVVLDTMWGYPSEIVWTKDVTPVAALVSGPFSGIVGTDGCEAVAYNDSRIKGWATACELVLGPQDIAVEGSPVVTYGNADEAVGPCDNNNLNVVSLGDGGMATLTFAHPITNGEGPDFAVFENSFNDTFLELAFVEVSTDGEHFVRFPATSLTSACANVGGTGGIDATYIDNLAGKYRTGYGTAFDLEQLRDSANVNIDSILYVRVVDVVGSVDPEYATYDQYGHIVVDPYPTDSYSSGFDLDGVCVINWIEGTTDTTGTEAIAAIQPNTVALYPNPATSQVTVSLSQAGQHAVVIYDMTGRMVESHTFAGKQATLNIAHLGRGIYMVSVDGNQHRKLVVNN